MNAQNPLSIQILTQKSNADHKTTSQKTSRFSCDISRFRYVIASETIDYAKTIIINCATLRQYRILRTKQSSSVHVCTRPGANDPFLMLNMPVQSTCRTRRGANSTDSDKAVLSNLCAANHLLFSQRI